MSQVKPVYYKTEEKEMCYYFSINRSLADEKLIFAKMSQMLPDY